MRNYGLLQTHCQKYILKYFACVFMTYKPMRGPIVTLTGAHVVVPWSFLLCLLPPAALTSAKTIQSGFSLQEGAERVIHRGQMQVLWVVALWVHLWFLVLVILPGLMWEQLLPPDRPTRTPFQADKDHVGKFVLQPLKVLAGKEETNRSTKKQVSSTKKYNNNLNV